MNIYDWFAADPTEILIVWLYAMVIYTVSVWLDNRAQG